MPVPEVSCLASRKLSPTKSSEEPMPLNQESEMQRRPKLQDSCRHTVFWGAGEEVEGPSSGHRSFNWRLIRNSRFSPPEAGPVCCAWDAPARRGAPGYPGTRVKRGKNRSVFGLQTEALRIRATRPNRALRLLNEGGETAFLCSLFYFQNWRTTRSHSSAISWCPR